MTTEKAPIVVDDVNTDARYLACSADTKSEIVVPIMKGSDVVGEIERQHRHCSAKAHRSVQGSGSMDEAAPSWLA